ncbi:iron ABC transporter permease [Facilibium subflavum]|uniref:iron ABC transporter permease n=1 Tax=Facilibium subflavum TaxID=2219058 RepID=UPI000E64FF34|nr:iron ABC transporter permease [Facilibium subflavum]
MNTRFLSRSSLLLLITAGAVLLALYYLHVASGDNYKLLIRHLSAYQINDVTLWYLALPRLFAAILAGSALALAGFLFQEASRNLLASPNLLGVGNGAHLALVITLVFFPTVAGTYQLLAAMIGGSIAAFIVFTLTYKYNDPVRIIFAGVAISLSLSAFAAILSLYFEQSVAGLFLWGAGDVEQQDWLNIAMLWKYIFGIILVSFMISRMIKIYGLGDESAASLGVPVNMIRWLMIGFGVVLTSCAVILVGPISFIGLFIPNVLRVFGIRSGKFFIFLCLILGALVLIFADLITLIIASHLYINVSVGVLTAVLGAPVLLWALLRLNRFSLHKQDKIILACLKTPLKMRYILLAGFGFIAIALLFSDGLMVLKSICNGQLFDSDTLSHFLYVDIRLPRIMLAILAGGALALSGLFFQGVIQNVLASPEVLGVTQGATCTALMLLIFFPQAPWWSVQLIAFLGGLLAFGIVIALAKKLDFQPVQLAMVGISLGALYAAINAGLLATSGMQASEVLRWLTGSFYGHGWSDVQRLFWIILITLPLCYLVAPWLNVLVFGQQKAKSLGLSLYLAQFVLLLLATLQSASVVASVGMFGFIGLMGPHCARMLGVTNPRQLVIISFIFGSLLAVFSDMLSTWLFSPTEIPAGLIAPIIGTLYLLVLLSRQRE